MHATFRKNTNNVILERRRDEMTVFVQKREYKFMLSYFIYFFIIMVIPLLFFRLYHPRFANNIKTGVNVLMTQNLFHRFVHDFQNRILLKIFGKIGIYH